MMAEKSDEYSGNKSEYYTGARVCHEEQAETDNPAGKAASEGVEAQRTRGMEASHKHGWTYKK